MPVPRSFDVFFDLCQNKRLSEKSWGWWFETPLRTLWRYCNDETGEEPWHVSLMSMILVCRKILPLLHVWAPFCYHNLTEIRAWINNYIHGFMWDVVTLEWQTSTVVWRKLEVGWVITSFSFLGRNFWSIPYARSWCNLLVKEALVITGRYGAGLYVMNLLPDTSNCGLCMRRESRERFTRHRGLAIPTCITGRAWHRCRNACWDR